MFTNETHEVGIEAFFTQNLRTEFERSRLAQLTSKADAQVILEGTILTLSFVPSVTIDSQSQTELVGPQSRQAPYPVVPGGSPLPVNGNPLPHGTVLSKLYTANLTVKIIARKVSDSSILWQGNFSGSRVYQAPLVGDPRNGLNSMNAIYNQSSRQLTVAAIAKDMMSEAHDRITENF